MPALTSAIVDDLAPSEAIELAGGLLTGHEDIIVLRVSGSSMMDALVNDGDLVVLNAVAEVHNGDMVAARVMGDDGQVATTLKYFYRENGYVRLQPAHPDMQPLFYRPEQVAVEGKVVLVIRQMA